MSSSHIYGQPPKAARLRMSAGEPNLRVTLSRASAQRCYGVSTQQQEVDLRTYQALSTCNLRSSLLMVHHIIPFKVRLAAGRKQVSVNIFLFRCISRCREYKCNFLTHSRRKTVLLNYYFCVKHVWLYAALCMLLLPKLTKWAIQNALIFHEQLVLSCVLEPMKFIINRDI